MKLEMLQLLHNREILDYILMWVKMQRIYLKDGNFPKI
jgi:hypothetical protein